MLDFLVQTRRNAKAATKLMRKLLEKQGSAAHVVTYRLRSCPAALRAMGLSARHDEGLRADNRAGNSHLPIRRRERRQQGFRSSGSAERFLSVHAATFNTFYRQRHLTTRTNYKQHRAGSLDAWTIASAAA